MRIETTTIALVLAMSVSTSAFAAGDHEHGAESDEPAAENSTGGHDHGSSAGNDQTGGMMDDMMDHMSGMMPNRTVEVVAQDTEFSASEIMVSPGETIRFVIHNRGDMPHDFTIGDEETQQTHRREMMAGMMGDEHGDMMGHMHGAQNAVLVPPGESREIVWAFTEGENLMFGCNMPGHFEAGMRGRFVTEE
jgi:uncharacterized cupredoxin-like copper-binding protein